MKPVLSSSSWSRRGASFTSSRMLNSSRQRLLPSTATQNSSSVPISVQRVASVTGTCLGPVLRLPPRSTVCNGGNCKSCSEETVSRSPGLSSPRTVELNNGNCTGCPSASSSTGLLSSTCAPSSKPCGATQSTGDREQGTGDNVPVPCPLSSPPCS